MIDLSSAKIDRFNEKYISVVSDATVKCEEIHPDGLGQVDITVKGDALFIKLPSKSPIVWAKNGKCADAALLRCNGKKILLDVVELKKTVTIKTWEHIKLQFEGMAINSIAVLAVGGLPQPDSLSCYVCYENDKIAVERTSDPALLKFALGSREISGSVLEWRSGRFDIGDFKDVHLIKVLRDQETGSGVIDFSS